MLKISPFVILRLSLQVNQLLSLFFIIMVQVVITTEWYVINMPLQTKVLFSQLLPLSISRPVPSKVTNGYPEAFCLDS